MSPSKILVLFLLSFVFGVFISSFFNIPHFIVYELFILAVFYLLIFRKEKQVVVFAFCFLFLGLGFLRTEGAKQELLRFSVLSSNEYLNKHQIEGTENISFSGLYRLFKINKSRDENSLVLSQKLSILKKKLKDIIHQNFSPPHSSILAAVLLGDKKTSSKEWNEKLNRAGIRHITAISGMHIIVLSGILMWLLISFGFYRGQAFYFAVILLWGFIVLVGLPASAVRAGIMGSLYLFSQKVGRESAGQRTLLLAVVLMLFFNPLLLRGDVGFQLSVLATLGIIYFKDFFESLFEKLSFLKTTGICDVLAMTFSAQFFTLPFLLYYFGYFSLVSPLGNMLVVPIIPFLMISGFLFLIFSLIAQPLGFLFSCLTFLLLDYVVWVTSLLSSLPYACKELPLANLFIILYVLFVVALLGWRKAKLQFKIVKI